MQLHTVASWRREHGAVFDELATATLTVALAAGRMRAAAGGSDLRAAMRAVELSAPRLVYLLQRAKALPEIGDADVQRRFSAGLARWSDAVDALTAATPTRDVDELARAARAGEAGDVELRMARQALQRASVPQRQSVGLVAP